METRRENIKYKNMNTSAFKMKYTNGKKSSPTMMFGHVDAAVGNNPEEGLKTEQDPIARKIDEKVEEKVDEVVNNKSTEGLV